MMTLEILGFLNLNFADILDIAVVASIIYFLFKWIKKSSALNIFIAIILLLAVRFIAAALNMKMLSALMGTVIDVGAVAIIIIFQPEIRHFLGRIGRSADKRSLLDRLLGRKKTVLDSASISEIADACTHMSEQKVGALIVLPNKDPIGEIIATGDEIDALIKCRLIENIFFKNSPLHDGAMIIDQGRIVAARCTLPMTDRNDIPAHYGMRHKASIGVSERYDCDVIVVSEQTGRISLVRDGQITEVTGGSPLRLALSEKLGRKSESEAGE